MCGKEGKAEDGCTALMIDTKPDSFRAYGSNPKVSFLPFPSDSKSNTLSSHDRNNCINVSTQQIPCRTLVQSRKDSQCNLEYMHSVVSRSKTNKYSPFTCRSRHYHLILPNNPFFFVPSLGFSSLTLFFFESFEPKDISDIFWLKMLGLALEAEPFCRIAGLEGAAWAEGGGAAGAGGPTGGTQYLKSMILAISFDPA